MSRQRQIGSADGCAAVEQRCNKLLEQSAGDDFANTAARAGLPDMVFTANAALIYRRSAVMAHFRHPERQGEVRFDEAWLRDSGLRASSTCPTNCISKGPATRYSAATRYSPAIGFAAMPADTSRSARCSAAA